MKVNKNNMFVFLIIILIFTNIFILTEDLLLKKEVINFNKNLTDSTEKIELEMKEITDGISLLLDRQEENNTNIKKDLDSVRKKTDTQISRTVDMSKTYNQILEEQKKKSIDTAEKDSFIIEAKKNAFALYEKGNFAEAYDEYKKILLLCADDVDSRLFKIKCLYYRNKADTSSYPEILSDIKFLKQNNVIDEEIIEIEKTVLAEKEGVNE